MAALISTIVLAGQTYPPPYPRSGTRVLIDNGASRSGTSHGRRDNPRRCIVTSTT
jgi:hypothetical protein